MKTALSSSNVIAVVQARSSSTRFPNKVLQPILDKPMLIHQLDRICKCKNIDKLIIATSTHFSDDGLANICHSYGYNVKRGSLTNVVQRFQTALEHEEFGYLVRLTGDCPLADPDVIDQVIAEHIERDADYTTNAYFPSFPDGLDVEVLKKITFEHVVKSACTPSQLEHVTPFIYENKQMFKIHHVTSAEDLSAYRWTVDECVDLELVRRVYENLYPRNPDFSMSDILDFIKERSFELPQNGHIGRNEGYAESIRKRDKT